MSTYQEESREFTTGTRRSELRPQRKVRLLCDMASKHIKNRRTNSNSKQKEEIDKCKDTKTQANNNKDHKTDSIRRRQEGKPRTDRNETTLSFE